MASTSASSAISTVQVKPGSKTSSSAVTSAMMSFAIWAAASAAAWSA